MPRAGHKQAKSRRGRFLQRDPPAAAKRGKIPDPAPAGLCRAAFAGGRPAFSEHIPHGPRVSARGSGAKAAACAGPAAAASARAAKNKKSPGRGADPRPGASRLLGAKRRGQRPPALRHHRRAPGIPAKKAADAALHGIASAAFCMVVLFWVAFGKVRVCAAPPPPGRKTRRPVFQPLCHACRMVSSAGAWQKE